MNPDFLNLLVHPETKEKLSIGGAQNSLTASSDPDPFPVVQGVPMLLPHHAYSNKATFNYQAHYEEDAKTYDYFKGGDSDHHVENHRLHQNILHMLPKNASWVLDVGCGGAWLAQALCKKGTNVISMDISTSNPIKATQKVASPYHFGLVADVYALPIKENSIDCIVASEIIEHVSNPKGFLEALLKVLKPGGLLIVTTPFNEKIQHSLCIHCNQLTPHNAHIHSFTKATLKNMVPETATSARTATFNNKILTVLRIDKLFRTLPFLIWKRIDQGTNFFFKEKALRLMLIVRK